MQRGRGSRHYIYYESYLNKIYQKKTERESILIILLVCCLKISKKMNLRSIENVKIRNSVSVVVGSCVTVTSLSVTMIKIARGPRGMCWEMILIVLFGLPTSGPLTSSAPDNRRSDGEDMSPLSSPSKERNFTFFPGQGCAYI